MSVLLKQNQIKVKGNDNEYYSLNVIADKSFEEINKKIDEFNTIAAAGKTDFVNKIAQTINNLPSETGALLTNVEKLQASNLEYNGIYIFNWALGAVASNTWGDNPTYVNYSTVTPRIRTANVIYFENEWLHISLDEGYKGWVYGSNGTASKRISGKNNYFYMGKNQPFGIILAKEDESEISVADAVHITIRKVKNELIDIGHGIFQIPIKWWHNSLFTYLAPIRYIDGTDGGVAYAYSSSQPISLSQGLSITRNPKYRMASYEENGVIKKPLYSFRVVKKTNNGLTFATDDEGLRIISSRTKVTRENYYIPPIEDAYIIIYMYYGSTAKVDLTQFEDFLIITTGTIKDSNIITNLTPIVLSHSTSVEGFDGEHVITVSLKERSTSTYSSAQNFGSLIRLDETKRIICSPQYGIIANIYKKENNNFVLYDFIYSGEKSTSATSASEYTGVSYIDFTKYDFEGFAVVAIHKQPIIKNTGKSVRIATGGLAGYDDVRNNVFFEYYPNVNFTQKSGMPSIMRENIKKLSNWTVENYPNGTYYHALDKTLTAFPSLENFTPIFYQGGFRIRSLLMHIPARVAMSDLNNPNGRMRRMVRLTSEGEEYRNSKGDRVSIGYGMTCTLVAEIIMGLKENYGSGGFVYSNPYKFESYVFDYKKHLDSLKPGDWLAQWKLPSRDGSTYEYNGHSMIVNNIYEKNGTIYCIEILEGWGPYPRLRPVFNFGYYDDFIYTLGSWVSLDAMRGINGFARIKPEFLNRIEDSYDLINTIPTGTGLYCDSGEGALYTTTSIVQLTITDPSVTTIRIYPPNTSSYLEIDVTNAYSKYENNIFQWRLLNIEENITEAGLYEITANFNGGNFTHGTSFYVIENLTSKVDITQSVIRDEKTYRILEIPNMEHLRHLDIYYADDEYSTLTRYDENGQPYPYLHITVAPEEVDHIIDNNVGVFYVPERLDSRANNAEICYLYRIYEHPESGCTYLVRDYNFNSSGIDVGTKGIITVI